MLDAFVAHRISPKTAAHCSARCFSVAARPPTHIIPPHNSSVYSLMPCAVSVLQRKSRQGQKGTMSDLVVERGKAGRTRIACRPPEELGGLKQRFTVPERHLPLHCRLVLEKHRRARLTYGHF